MTATARPAILDEPRWKTVLRRTIVVMVILGIGAGFWFAASRTKTGDGSLAFSGDTPAARILSPKNGETVVNQQAQISLEVDLRYLATITITDAGNTVIPIPDDQVTKLSQAGATQLLFTPGEGKVLAVLPTGRTCVNATLYRVDGTAEIPPPLSWCFQVV